MARIATGNYDAVIVSHSSFEFLPVSDETFERFVEKQIADSLKRPSSKPKREKGDNRRIVKELEKAKKRLETKLKERADRERKDNAVTFEQLGVDQMFVDEADLYKNLGYITKMNRIAGLPTPKATAPSTCIMKTRYLRENAAAGRGICHRDADVQHDGGDVHDAALSCARTAASAGVEHFDAWAANFGEAVTALELAPDGSGYRMHTRFAKFVNLPELLTMFRTLPMSRPPTC